MVPAVAAGSFGPNGGAFDEGAPPNGAGSVT
jgi:hypothetical protein